MATGSLIKIDEEIVTSAVASVTLTGIDSTYDVYMVAYNNVLSTTDGVSFVLRYTVSGTADSSANYDGAWKNLRADTTFQNNTNLNNTEGFICTLGTAGNEQANGVMYLFNFNNASEYSFHTLENTARENDGNLKGFQGGQVLTVAQACDGVQFFMSSGNIDTGSKFVLYGLKK